MEFHMSISLTVDLVVTDGRIDEEASQEAFASALSRQVAEMETLDGQIADAVHSVFDTATPGAPLTYDTIATLA